MKLAVALLGLLVGFATPAVVLLSWLLLYEWLSRLLGFSSAVSGIEEIAIFYLGGGLSVLAAIFVAFGAVLAGRGQSTLVTLGAGSGAIAEFFFVHHLYRRFTGPLHFDDFARTPFVSPVDFTALVYAAMGLHVAIGAFMLWLVHRCFSWRAPGEPQEPF